MADILEREEIESLAKLLMAESTTLSRADFIVRAREVDERIGLGVIDRAWVLYLAMGFEREAASIRVRKN